MTRKLRPRSTLTVSSVEAQGSRLVPCAMVEVDSEASCCVCIRVGSSDYVGCVLFDGLAMLSSGRGRDLVVGDLHWNVPELACVEQ